MTDVIHVKLGTMPAEFVRILAGEDRLEVGQRITFATISEIGRGIIREIKELSPDDKLFYIELM